MEKVNIINLYGVFGRDYQARASLSGQGISHSIAGEQLFRNFNLTVTRGEKIVIVSRNSVATSALLEIVAGELLPDEGTVQWGQTVRRSFLPKDATELFEKEIDLIDWLRQYSEEQDENFVRGFLGRMLFTGEETRKNVTVLSGGEKVRCMISRIMLEDPHAMVLDVRRRGFQDRLLSAVNGKAIAKVSFFLRSCGTSPKR